MKSNKDLLTIGIISACLFLVIIIFAKEESPDLGFFPIPQAKYMVSYNDSTAEWIVVDVQDDCPFMKVACYDTEGQAYFPIRIHEDDLEQLRKISKASWAPERIIPIK